jgi:hypothetical protein
VHRSGGGRCRTNATSCYALDCGYGACGTVSSVDSACAWRRRNRSHDLRACGRRSVAHRWRHRLVPYDRRRLWRVRWSLARGGSTDHLRKRCQCLHWRSVSSLGTRRDRAGWVPGLGALVVRQRVSALHMVDRRMPDCRWQRTASGRRRNAAHPFLLFPESEREIIDTWDSIGLRGTGSHDYAVDNIYVPAEHSLSLQEPPVAPGPLYSLPFIAVACTAIAAVAFGIAHHAIDILISLAGSTVAVRTRQVRSEDALLQDSVGRAVALVSSARAFLFEALGEAWGVACSGNALSITQRATLWLAATHAATSAKQAAELMVTFGG